MVNPVDCFDSVVTKLANTVANHARNMTNEFAKVQDILIVGNACLNYILLRPKDFDRLSTA